MSEPVKTLIVIHFPTGGMVTYSDNFNVTLDGFLYPRQLRTASEIVDLYKKCSREDNSRKPTKCADAEKSTSKKRESETSETNAPTSQ
jgi:hypothetical protein